MMKPVAGGCVKSTSPETKAKLGGKRKQRQDEDLPHNLEKIVTWDLPLPEEPEPSDQKIWTHFDDLERIDSTSNEIEGAFSDFKPIRTDTESDAVEEHDLVF